MSICDYCKIQHCISDRQCTYDLWKKGIVLKSEKIIELTKDLSSKQVEKELKKPFIEKSRKRQCVIPKVFSLAGIFLSLLCFLFAANIPVRPDIRPFDDNDNPVNITTKFGDLRHKTEIYSLAVNQEWVLSRSDKYYSHIGTDYSLPLGTTINSTADGIVTLSKWLTGYGNTIIIDHGNGIETWYCHIDEFLVLKGQKVSKKQSIGKVGNNGSSIGAHLHYGMKKNDQWIWPGTFQRIRGIEEGRIKL